MDRVMRAIRRIHHCYGQYSKRLEERAGVTAPQLACLTVLSRNEAVPAGRLSDQISIDPSTMTGILDRLEKHGLVVRRHDADDRRVWNVRITSAGRRLVDSTPPTMGRGLAAVLGKRPKSERSQTLRALERIGQWMEEVNART